MISTYVVKSMIYSDEEESISHLLYYCTYANNIWSHISKALEFRETITHDKVIFGRDAYNVLNHILSIIVYFIYREWLIPSLEKRIRRLNLCVKSLINYLVIRRNIYSKCTCTIWNDVCVKLDNIISYMENM